QRLCGAASGLGRVRGAEPGISRRHHDPLHRWYWRRRIPAWRGLPLRFHRFAARARIRAACRSNRLALRRRAAHRGHQHWQWPAGHHSGLPFGKSAMSVSGETKPASAERRPSWSQWAAGNVARYFALLRRPPRRCLRSPWLAPIRLAVAAAVVTAALGLAMTLVDSWAIAAVRHLPLWLISVFDEATHFGKSVRFLLPVAVVLAAMAALASP